MTLNNNKIQETLTATFMLAFSCPDIINGVGGLWRFFFLQYRILMGKNFGKYFGIIGRTIRQDNILHE